MDNEGDDGQYNINDECKRQIDLLGNYLVKVVK